MSETTVQPVAARFVGQAVARKEDRRLVTGHGQYVDDVAVPGLLHGAFLRSEVAKGAIASIDTSAAVALPGVVAVYTWADFNGRFGEAWHAMLGEEMVVPPPLAIGDVRYVGDPVVLVVAESRYIAEDACDLISVEYQPERAAVDYAAAAHGDEPPVHAAWGLASNAMVAAPFMALSPDLDAAFTGAAHVVECTIEQNRYVPVPMETRGIVAWWHDGRDELDVTCSTQSVHETRNFFARYLGIPEGHVRVTARDVGGGFGQKMFVFREECAVVLASRILGRPVKWVEDRRENLISGPHARNEQGLVRIALDGEGVIQAMTVDHVGDVGAYPACPAVMDPTLLPGPYRVPRLGFSMSMVWTNTMGKGAYRGPWMFETTAREMAIDVAAAEIGMDAAELRRRNLLSMADLPFTSPAAKVFEEITPLETFEQALAMLDYEGFRREQAAARAQGRYLGVGISVYVEPTSMGSPTLYTEAATVRVESSGSVVAYLGTTSHGQSIETTMAQVVADTLGVRYDDVTIVQADTQSTPYGPGTGGSRTAVIAGGAAREASEVVRGKVLAIAAHAMEASPDDLEVRDGTVSVRGTPTKSMSMKDVAKLAYRTVDQLGPDVEPGLEATVRFRPSRFPTWSNATHVCVVEVDPRTWMPRILRYIVSEDCGRMINPNVVEGQIFGGVVQGIGGVLLEDFVYDGDGNPLTTTFMDYLLPTASDVPDIEVGHIETVSTTNPGGYKGLGEGGAIGSHAAVANAVGDALAPFGVRVTRTPLGPKDIFRLVAAASGAS
ncbi:MAG TPA: xanthine dehydrogenase family protein molybdopterin-binding subunit [Acidimicrobiales bacterium]|nr:xanthine dehydrogenase family protein molybdopterin-binding subunit [Acidimicrobiales bacterium]